MSSVDPSPFAPKEKGVTKSEAQTDSVLAVVAPVAVIGVSDVFDTPVPPLVCANGTVVVRVVNVPVFGVVFPIGGGEASKPEKKLVEPIRLTVKPLGADMMTSIYGNMKKKLVVLATAVEV